MLLGMAHKPSWERCTGNPISAGHAGSEWKLNAVLNLTSGLSALQVHVCRYRGKIKQTAPMLCRGYHPCTVDTC